MKDLADIMGQMKPHPQSRKEMVVVYRSPVDGVNRGMRRSDFDQESWDKAMRSVTGLDTPVWVFGSESAAEQFGPDMIPMYEQEEKREQTP